YVYPSSTTAGVVVSPAARRAVVLVAERVKDEEKMTRVLWCDTAAGTVLREWRGKGIYAPPDPPAGGHRAPPGSPPGPGATPALTPDGSRVVFLTKSGAALLDPAGPKVVGVRPVEGPADPVLAVSPDGKSLACAANGRVALLDLAGGQVRTATLPKLEVAR